MTSRLQSIAGLFFFFSSWQCEQPQSHATTNLVPELEHDEHDRPQVQTYMPNGNPRQNIRRADGIEIVGYCNVMAHEAAAVPEGCFQRCPTSIHMRVDVWLAAILGQSACVTRDGWVMQLDCTTHHACGQHCGLMQQPRRLVSTKSAPPSWTQPGLQQSGRCQKSPIGHKHNQSCDVDVDSLEKCHQAVGSRLERIVAMS